MGMQKYMGYRAPEPVQRPERLLPEMNISGTMFYIDVAKLEFREVSNPSNRMPMIGAKEEVGLSHFFFDTTTKNHYTGDTTIPSGISNHVHIVFLQPLKDLDPIGLARKLGLRDDFYSNRNPLRIDAIVIAKEKQTTAQVQKPKGQRR